MTDRANILRLARNLARQNARRHNARHKNPSRELDLAREIKTLRLRAIPPALWDELDALLDHNPSFGLALARVLHAIAKQKRRARLRAQADLALIRALNVCGEFKRALVLCPATARRFEKLNDEENTARVWLEAAWAETWLGELPTAKTYLEHAAVTNAASANDELALKQAWIRARVLRLQGFHNQALAEFQALAARLHAKKRTLDAARVRREIGRTQVRISPQDALLVLVRARQQFARANCPLEAAQCGYFQAQALIDLNRFAQAEQQLAAVRAVLKRHANRFFAAWCDLELGFLRSEQDRPRDAIRLYQRARIAFIELDAAQEIASIDINLGWQLLRLNRYLEALARFEAAAQIAWASGRQTKAALCFMNMGVALTHQGNYARAVAQCQRAREIFAREKMRERMFEVDLHLGQVYFQVGEYAQALRFLNEAHAVGRTHGMAAKLGTCELFRARVWMAQGNKARARIALHAARRLFERNRQGLMAALCDRELAHLAIETGDVNAARKHLAASRRKLTAAAQPIESALCDLETAELALAERKYPRAARLYAAAQQRFDSGMPDLAWRAEFGMGRVAEARGAPTTALSHYRAAVAQIAQLRGTLGTEQFSNTFFETRQQVYAHALHAAYAHHDTAVLLEIIEAAKARLVSVLLARREWRPSRKPGNRMEQALYTRQMELRARLERLQGALMEQAPSTDVPLLREGRVDSQNTMREFRAAREEYEEIIAQLSVMRQGLEGAPDLAPFSLQGFRAAAHARWGTRWAALTYCFTRQGLLIVGVDAEQEFAQRVRLSRQDKFLLEQYCDTRRDLRELKYRGTLHGIPLAQKTAGEWNALTELLMPAAIRKRTDEPTLLISPHGQLHQFPFHALRDKQGYLLERFGFLYTPTLQVWTQLNAAPQSTTLRMLLCGVDDFQERARPLPFVRAEVRALQALRKGKVTTLWGQHATRGELLARNDKDALREFDVLHFATHAIVEPRTPHWSRILLADQDLSTADILDLRLNARLVTLSACATALGKGGQGDEWVALARAFFYAGARTVVATQWEVEDQAATRDLMGDFYQRLARGASIAEALRQAQLRLLHRGAPPFDWAAYAAVGAE